MWVRLGLIQNNSVERSVSDMKIIGITGGTGAGKSILSKALEKCGATVIDADKISRQVASVGGTAFDEIVSYFGKDILMKNGEIDRKLLGNIVFNDINKLAALDEITHKHIFEEMEKQLKFCKTDIVVLDVPLLFSCDFPIKCDKTVAVIADDEIRLKRIMNRDNISDKMARARMNNQFSNETYRQMADICFENNGDVSAVEDFAKKLCFGDTI